MLCAIQTRNPTQAPQASHCGGASYARLGLVLLDGLFAQELRSYNGVHSKSRKERLCSHSSATPVKAYLSGKLQASFVDTRP